MTREAREGQNRAEPELRICGKNRVKHYKWIGAMRIEVVDTAGMVPESVERDAAQWEAIVIALGGENAY